MNHVQKCRSKLQKLHCPFLCPSDDSQLSELLFTPSTARTDLLLWLVNEFGVSLKTGRNVEAVAALFDIFKSMGLCKDDDSSLIMATAPEKSQAAFWNNLLDLVLKKKTSCSLLSNGLGDSFPKELSQKSSLEDYSSYENSIIDIQNYKPLLNKQISLFTPDIKHILDCHVKDNSIKKLTTSTQDELFQQLNSCENNLQKRLALLQEKKMLTEEKTVDHLVENKNCLGNSLEKFSENMAHFNKTVEKMDPWLDQEPPTLSFNNNNFNELCMKFENYTKFLENARSNKSAASSLALCKKEIDGLSMPKFPLLSKGSELTTLAEFNKKESL